jgi:hypothetical protein
MTSFVDCLSVCIGNSNVYVLYTTTQLDCGIVLFVIVGLKKEEGVNPKYPVNCTSPLDGVLGVKNVYSDVQPKWKYSTTRPTFLCTYPPTPTWNHRVDYETVRMKLNLCTLLG